LSAAFNITDATDGTAAVQSVVRSELGRRLPPQDVTESRRCGGASPNSLWIGVNATRQQQPNIVIDEDPITRFRTIFAGTQSNLAMIVEQRPLHQAECTYDPGRGTLVGVRTTRRMPAGQVQVGQAIYQLQLTGQR
jgi:hypothetical protein